MLSARDLEHRYDGRRVLAIPRLDLVEGGTTAIVGPNGSGKSTLLRILAALERPASGTVFLDGRPLVTERDRRAARRRVTLVEQHPLLFPGTVRENLLYALGLHGLRGAEAARRVAAVLERFGLGPLAERQAPSLSDGEMQRAALGRALALEPDVLLLDEPLSVADRAAAHHLHRELDAQRQRGTTLCIASHRLEDAYRWADTLLALAHGSVAPVTPENLFRVTIPEGEGARRVAVGPLTLELVTDRSGPATVAIPPDDVIVSRQPFESSVRNQFRGRVTAVRDSGRGGIALTVDVGLDLTVRITRRALEDLAISVGTEVVLSVKAMAVRVY